MTVAYNPLEKTVITLSITIVGQISGKINKVTKVLLPTVISDMTYAHLDGLTVKNCVIIAARLAKNTTLK